MNKPTDQPSQQCVTLREAIASLEKLADCDSVEEYGKHYEIVHEYLSQPTAPEAAKPEPCRDKTRSIFGCKNRHQCWEPCGELGHSAEHARPATKETQDAVNAALGMAAKPEMRVEREELIARLAVRAVSAGWISTAEGRALLAENKPVPVKPWRQRLEETAERTKEGNIHTSIEEIEDLMQAEIDDLRALLAADKAGGEVVAWPVLDKPARVGGASFGKGVNARLVVECAQRLYEYEAEDRSKTPEQRRDDEIKRRKVWDMINGPIDTHPQPQAEAVRVPDGWMPIETAPKDGTAIWLYFPNLYWRTGNAQSVGFWSDSEKESHDDPDHRWYEGEADSSSMVAFGSYPTHWMPLFAAPKVQEQKA